MTINVLFVCLGNICRSPTAQGIFKKIVTDAGLDQEISVDSCGTAAFNVGKHPDERAIHAAANAGYDISQQIARQIQDEDYQHFDFIIAMDRANLTNILAWAPNDFAGEIKLFMDYCKHTGNAQIPDPYYAKDKQFEKLITVLENAANGLLSHIQKRHSLSS